MGRDARVPCGGFAVFDDHDFDPGPRSGGCPEAERRRTIEYVRDTGPIPVVSLQADLYPYEPQRFGRLLASLLREGVVCVSGGSVEARFDTTLGEPETVELSTLTVTLRPATGPEFPALRSLARAVARGGDHAGVTQFARRTVSDGPIHRSDDDRRRTVYVADIDGRLGGWVHLSATPDSGRSDGAQLLGGVADRFRGRGVGSQLLQYGMDRARKQGYPSVYQYVPAHDDDAFRFLRTHGWSVDGTRRGTAPTDPDELRVAQDLDCPSP